MNIPFIDLRAQLKEIHNDSRKAINRVMQRGDFILGEDVRLFEGEFSRYCRVKYSVGVNSGTDALFLSLLGQGIGKNDEVIVPALSFIATAFAVSHTGARPVFVDIDENTYNIDADKIEEAITRKTRAIIPVHLFGQPARMDAILKIARRYRLKVIEDAAQAHGALFKGRKVGSWGESGCFSFYPTKNLGAAGDAGMITVDEPGIYKKLLILRDCGRKTHYEHIVKGYNSRLDTLQAAVLRVKLKKIDSWNNARRKNASLYDRLLADAENIILPREDKDCFHVYHQYAVRLKNRDKVRNGLQKQGIGSAVYYPKPLHLQPAYRELGYKANDFPAAEKTSREILSLPMHPYLRETQIVHIVKTLRRLIK